VTGLAHCVTGNRGLGRPAALRYRLAGAPLASAEGFHAPCGVTVYTEGTIDGLNGLPMCVFSLPFSHPTWLLLLSAGRGSPSTTIILLRLWSSERGEEPVGSSPRVSATHFRTGAAELSPNSSALGELFGAFRAFSCAPWPARGHGRASGRAGGI
jgi:hypothetical protein